MLRSLSRRLLAALAGRSRPRRPDLVHRYGPAPDQYLELTLPAPVQERTGSAGLTSTSGGSGRAPVAVVLHGGFWRAAYGIELARPLAADLAAAGWAAVAVEYRRVGTGGGWPATLEDVATALDCLAELPVTAGLDLGDVTVVGHSAGGHLAAWAAGRARLTDGAPGARPRVRVTAVVLQAGVLDLGDGLAAGLGGGAVRDFLGSGPEARLSSADPVRLLPTGARVLCVHGADDDVVPVRQSERYAAAAAAAGDAVEVRVVPGDHMQLIDPAGPSWRLVRDWLTPAANR